MDDGMTDSPESKGNPPAPAKKPNPKFKTLHLQEPFLRSYEETENLTLSAERVGVSYETVNRWKKEPVFMRKFLKAHFKAQQKNNDLLRSSLIQRAVRGTPHFLIRNGAFVRDEQGNKVVAYYDQEPQLTLFVAKNRLPDEFRDKFEFEITGQIVKMLVTEFFGVLRRRLTPEQVIPIQQELETLSAKLMTTT